MYVPIPVMYLNLPKVSAHHRHYKFYYKSLYYLQILWERYERSNPFFIKIKNSNGPKTDPFCGTPLKTASKQTQCHLYKLSEYG